MTEPPAGGKAVTEGLTFWSFVDYAVGRAAERLPGIDSAAMRLIITLNRAAGMVEYDLESAVHRPRGWTWPGFRLLFILWLAGPLESKRVAELSGMSRQAVSALVNTLERDGLVCRDTPAHDRRSVMLALSDRGLAAIEDAFSAHNRRERLWAGSLSTEERETLTRLLAKLIGGADHSEIRRRI